MAGAARTRICLACRTLFAQGESCPGKRPHETVSLAEVAGARRLADEVWGPDSRARKARQAVKAGATGAASGTFFDGCSGCDIGDVGDLGGEAFLIVLAVVVAGCLAILLFFLIRALVRFIREKLDRPKPHGALLRAPRPRARVVAATGTIRGGTPMTLPWIAGSAFGYALELYEARTFGGGAMLRDAVSSGFEVALDDGRVLRVPAGRIRVTGKLPKVAAERTRLEGMLGGLPQPLEESAPLFPFDHARAATLGPGDRIELLGDVTMAAAGGSGYRDQAGVLEPASVPVLRILTHERVEGAAPAGVDVRDDAETELGDEGDEEEAAPARRT